MYKREATSAPTSLLKRNEPEVLDISIRHFKSRWASCDEGDVIQFRPKVMELARTVQDYIIIHELCHMIEKNHTKAFWDLVAQCMPDWKKTYEALERSEVTDTI